MTQRPSGIAFPFRIRGGRVLRSEGLEKIVHDVRHLLATRLGERLMLRSYGGGVHQRLQEPNDHTLRTLIGHEIEQAFRSHLPELRLLGPVSVSATEETLRVTVEYRADVRSPASRVELELP